MTLMRPLIEVPQCLFMLIDGLEENKREIASVAEGPDLFIFFFNFYSIACQRHLRVFRMLFDAHTKLFCISFVEKDETRPTGRTGFPRKREKRTYQTKMSQNIFTPDLLNPHHEPSQSEEKKRKFYWSALHNVGSRCK
ncbi:hypothetical protein OUZ56_007553 [Daphnia magna]|uniref:Uncharacterized protein n=1 Tax=Daphnia magna TaxID=35525 RepID=A0ABR0AAB0_9CRUS|nr:hypothetical protein OUZ56_007553 [Daphnia magna]